MSASRTLLQNDRGVPITLFLEPRGADYTMNPGDVFEVREEQPTESFYLQIVYGEQMIVVWVEGHNACPEIYLDGKLLECGHNRQLSPIDDVRNYSPDLE